MLYCFRTGCFTRVKWLSIRRWLSNVSAVLEQNIGHVTNMSGLLEIMNLSSFPTSRLFVNLALLTIVSYVSYVLISVFVRYIVYWIGQEWAFRNISSFHISSYLIGHAVYLKDSGKGLEWYASCTERYPKTHSLRMGPVRLLVVHHPDTAKVFLSSEPKLEFIYAPTIPWLGESLLTGSGSKWLRTRRLLTPSFHFDILKPYVKVFSEAVQVTVSKWSKLPEGQSIEIFHDISLLTLDVMLQCTCSCQSNCQIGGTHNEYIEAVYDLSKLVYERVSCIHFYFDTVYFMSKAGKQFRKACDTVHSFSMDVIRKRRKELRLEEKEKQESFTGKRRKYLDFIDTLLEAKDADGVGMTDAEMRAEVDTFMFEGHDTTASGISWMLYNMAQHPEHQARVHEEVDAFFDSLEDGVFTWDMLARDNNLEYLTMCLKESMRLFPPVPVIGRRITKETEIDGHKLPPDSKILLVIYALHRHPDIWENPEEFDPERFSRENEGNIPPFAYVPFSAGSRNCIGRHFALNEEKCVLASLFRHFEFSVDKDKPSEIMATVIIKAKDGLYLKIKKRHK